MVGPQTHLVARYLDLLSLSQKVTAANIANADTPGHKTLGFDFQGGAQARAIRSDRGAARPAAGPGGRRTAGEERRQRRGYGA